MTTESLIVAPGPRDGTVRTSHGQVLTVPAGWELLPPGDAWATKKVKAAGPTWTVQEKRGRKLFGRGIWAPKAHIAAALAEVAERRSTAEHAAQLSASRERRARAEEAYAEDFAQAVFQFLGFHPRHAELGLALAEVVAQHATPVGSGTVARTKRIPVEKRAEAALIAWMRHQTTQYDHMKIARVKGLRREVRRALAEQSRALLEPYRRGAQISAGACPLRRALDSKVRDRSGAST